MCTNARFLLVHCLSFDHKFDLFCIDSQALDLLQQHANQFYASSQGGGAPPPPGAPSHHHKIHELSEVGRKEGAPTPSPPLGGGKGAADREPRELERDGSPFR